MMGTRSPLVVILSCLRSPLHNFRDGIHFHPFHTWKFSAYQRKSYDMLRKFRTSRSSRNAILRSIAGKYDHSNALTKMDQASILRASENVCSIFPD